MTRNHFVGQPARGFESHRLRYIQIKKPSYVRMAFDILISKIMRQASEDAFVGPTNPSALAEQGGDGA